MADVRSRLAERAPMRLAIVGIPLLALAVLVVVLLGGALSDDDVDGKRGASADDTGDAGTAADGGAATGGSDDGTREGATAEGASDDELIASGVGDPYQIPEEQLPIAVQVSDTTGLSDGDEITFDVAADDGSEIYGIEARLCAGDAEIQGDSDMRPTQSGKCIPEPLSPQSDAYINVPNPPPYDAMTATFRVGIGTSTYTTQDGDDVTITCDHDHPCLLAVKYQVPNGYGFRTYPVEYR